MSEIRLENAGVDFVIFESSRNLRLSFLGGITGGRILPKRLSTQSVIVKALEDISLEIRSGDRVGLMGHNGAGKTTLLRVLGGIYAPTSGRIFMSGRITPFLNQAPGMEAEDSGYDNIITCGMMLGMSFEEISAKAPAIVEFSDLGDYIHFPVRTYSSGMQARLSFSIATSIEPGILLLDEGIGAADAQFAEKASRRVKELFAKTEGLVIASHSDALIDQLCDKAVLMHHGRILEIGTVATVTKSYRRLVNSAL